MCLLCIALCVRATEVTLVVFGLSPLGRVSGISLGIPHRRLVHQETRVSPLHCPLSQSHRGDTGWLLCCLSNFVKLHWGEISVFQEILLH